MQVSFKLSGFKSLEDKLRRLSPAIAGRGIRRATFEGVKVIRDAAKVNAVRGGKYPKKYLGYLVANIVAPRRRTEETTAKYSIVVRGTTLTKVARRKRATSRGPAGGYRAVAGPAIYGRFLEYGTSKNPAYPFLTPAYFDNKDRAIAVIKRTLAKIIADELKKGGGT